MPGTGAPVLPQARRGSDFRLVVMSATLDAARFVDYFPGAVAAMIRGRQFPVQVGLIGGGHGVGAVDARGQSAVRGPPVSCRRHAPLVLMLAHPCRKVADRWL